jgi:hypothetical protein
MSESVLLIERAGEVATLTLNRPEQFNALSEALLEAMQAALDELAADAAVRVGGDCRRRQGVLCPATTSRRCAPTIRMSNMRDLFRRCGRLMTTMTRRCRSR